jgi:hypothetical protein
MADLRLLAAGATAFAVLVRRRGARPRRIGRRTYAGGKRGADDTAETVDLAVRPGFRKAFTTISGFALRRRALLNARGSSSMSEVIAAELAHRVTYTWAR